MLLSKIYFISFLAIFSFFKITNVYAVSDQDKVCQEIWGSDNLSVSKKSMETSSKRINNNRGFENVCKLTEEYMVFAKPFDDSCIDNPDIYKNDNSLYVTVVFSPSYDLWNNIIYNHTGLIFEYYDEELKKIITKLYHLRSKKTWEWTEITFYLGYSYKHYEIGSEKLPDIVKTIICNEKNLNNQVTFEPYKTFKIKKEENSEIIKMLFPYIEYLNEDKRYCYSIYGAKCDYQIDNCVSFVERILWKLKIFKDEYQLNDILKYNKYYSMNPDSPYIYFSRLLPYIINNADIFKHLLDNKSMINESCIHIDHWLEEGVVRAERNRYNRTTVNQKIKDNIVGLYIKKFMDK
jgi:hypothetical protein